MDVLVRTVKMKRKFKKRRPFQERENPHRLFRKMTRDHVDVLENIEFVLVQAWREHPGIDDCLVEDALDAAIAGDTASDPLSDMMLEQLNSVRLMRSDIDDKIWKAGLKVVLKSVHNHSDAMPGERDYLVFADQFIP